MRVALKFFDQVVRGTTSVIAESVIELLWTEQSQQPWIDRQQDGLQDLSNPLRDLEPNLTSRTRPRRSLEQVSADLSRCAEIEDEFLFSALKVLLKTDEALNEPPAPKRARRTEAEAGPSFKRTPDQGISLQGAKINGNVKSTEEDQLSQVSGPGTEQSRRYVMTLKNQARRLNSGPEGICDLQTLAYALQYRDKTIDALALDRVIEDLSRQAWAENNTGDAYLKIRKFGLIVWQMQLGNFGRTDGLIEVFSQPQCLGFDSESRSPHASMVSYFLNQAWRDCLRSKTSLPNWTLLKKDGWFFCVNKFGNFDVSVKLSLSDDESDVSLNGPAPRLNSSSPGHLDQCGVAQVVDSSFVMARRIWANPQELLPILAESNDRIIDSLIRARWSLERELVEMAKA